MDQFHLLTPEQAAIARATAAGWIVAMIMLRRGWLEIVSWLAVGQLSSYHLVIPAAMYWGLAMAYYEPIGFCWGAFGMFIWTALFGLAQKFSVDPLGTFTSVWRTVRGQGGEGQ